MSFTAIFEPQADGGYHAMCPTLPGCHSEGEILDQAMTHIREATAVYTEGTIDRGEAPLVEDSIINPLKIAIAV